MDWDKIFPIIPKIRLLYSIYNLWLILLFLCRSGDEWRMVLKYIHCDGRASEFWKGQSHNCAMAAVGVGPFNTATQYSNTLDVSCLRSNFVQSTVVALIAINSLLLQFTSQVHWVAGVMWIVSMLSAFLSVLLACKQQKFIGSLLFEEEQEQKWDCKEQEQECHCKAKEEESHCKAEEEERLPKAKNWLKEMKDKGKFRKPRLFVVILLSSSKAALGYALMTYVIGLGVYLGIVWQNNLDVDAGHFDSRNIFIVFLIYTVFGICAYVGLTLHNSCLDERWSSYWQPYKKGEAAHNWKHECGGGQNKGYDHAHRTGNVTACCV